MALARNVTSLQTRDASPPVDTCPAVLSLSGGSAHAYCHLTTSIAHSHERRAMAIDGGGGGGGRVKCLIYSLYQLDAAAL